MNGYVGKCFRQFRKFFLLRILYPLIYKIGALEPLKENQVLFIENTAETLSNNFSFLYNKLIEDYSFDVHICFLRRNSRNRWGYLLRCLCLVHMAARTKYIFLADALNIFGCIPIRRGCIFTQLWHGCGAFKKFGFSTADMLFGDSRRELEHYSNYKYNTYMTVSSPEVIWAYEEATGLPKEKILPLGISRTDCLFDTTFVAEAYRHLANLMPERGKRKILLYAPTFRESAENAKAPRALSVSTLFYHLSDSYVLLIKQHPLVGNLPAIPQEYQTFARDFTSCMDIEELLCVADICITDYSSLIFEYSLFEKPMLFFAYDYEEYCDWRNFYYAYHDWVPGPVCTTTEAVITALQSVEDWFNRENIIKFKETFMSSCDGQATQRIMWKVFGEALNQFKKNG